jgi:Holliday junction DNA helicase RuvA
MEKNMISYLSGKIKDVSDKTITLLVNNIGFLIYVPQPSGFSVNSSVELFTYLHWNPENGPSFYGFQTELERKVFLMIIECPKIGPSIALNILSQVGSGEFLNIVNSQNEKALSAVNGIGEKKAEQIIVTLKHKVSKLLASGQINIPGDQQQSFVQWQNVNDVLCSLGYTKQETYHALQHLSKKYNGETTSLDQLIRSALTFLSANKA